MTDFTKYDASTHPEVKLENDYNSIVDHAFEKPLHFLICKKGTDYQAIYGSGSDQAGKIAKEDASFVTVWDWVRNSGLTAGRDFKETVLFKGNLVSDGKLQIPSYTKVVIDGKIKFGAILDAHQDHCIVNEGEDTTGVTDVEIHGGQIDCNRTVAGSAPWDCGVAFFKSERILLDNVEVFKSKTHAFHIDTFGALPSYMSHIQISNCKAHDSYDGFVIYGTVATPNGYFVVLSNCLAWVNENNDFILRGQRYASLQGCVSGKKGVKSSGMGIHLDNCVYCSVDVVSYYAKYNGVVVDNGSEFNKVRAVIHYPVWQGVWCEDSDHNDFDVIIAENQSVSYDLIYLESSNDCTIRTILDGGLRDGIRIEDSNDTIITGSRITGCAGYGVNEVGTSDYTLLDGINLRGNTTGAHTVDAANSVVGDIIS